MLQIVFGAMIGCLLTFVILAIIAFFVYKKYKPIIDTKISEVEYQFNQAKEAIDDVTEKIEPVVTAIEKIAEKVEKLPFNS